MAKQLVTTRTIKDADDGIPAGSQWSFLVFPASSQAVRANAADPDNPTFEECLFTRSTFLLFDENGVQSGVKDSEWEPLLTVGAGKGFDAAAVVASLKAMYGHVADAVVEAASAVAVAAEVDA